MPCAIETTKRFRSAVKGREAEVARALAQIQAGFGHPHRHGGLGIRKLAPNLFECRAGLKLRLEFLARKRKLRRSEVLRFVLYTTVFGLIVAAVALAGQFEIKALDHTMGSYDRPLVMFVIGLAAAMGGLQIIVAWYNSLRPKEEKPDA